MKQNIAIAMILTVAMGAGIALQRYLTIQGAPKAPPIIQATTLIGTQRPEIVMRDLDGTLRKLSEWDGKILLVNFWATWCPPCMKEIPFFIELQNRYADEGLQIIGVAIDKPDVSRQFAEEIGINYPVLPGDLGAIEITKQYGNALGGLPYSVFVNREGLITHTKTGELHPDEAYAILEELGLKLTM